MQTNFAQTHGYVTIRTADIVAASDFARGLGMILDRTYGGLQETMDVAARKCGIRGNHEPKWTDEQRAVFLKKFGV